MFQSFISGFKGLFLSSKENESAPEGFVERRKLVRLRCSYELKAVLHDKKFKATVVDMGAKGLKLRTGQPLKVGDKISLLPPGPVSEGGEPVDCKVLWVKQSGRGYSTYAGLLFTIKKEQQARSWVRFYLTELGFNPKTVHSQRRFLRADCVLEARYHSPSLQRTGSGRVYNLGVGGLLLESSHDLPLQEPLEIDFAGGDGLRPLKLVGYPIKSKNDGKVKLIGVEFRDLNAPQLEGLGRYLKHLLKANWNQA